MKREIISIVAIMGIVIITLLISLTFNQENAVGQASKSIAGKQNTPGPLGEYLKKFDVERKPFDTLLNSN